MFSPSEMEYTVNEVANLLNTDTPPKLVDIRQPHEYEIVRLENGQLLTQELVDDILTNWEKDTPIICYCHHGGRSMQATMFFRQNGFTNVRSMKGGINQWAMEIDTKLPRY